MQGVNLEDTAALSRRDAIFGEIFLHNAVDIHDPASSLMYRWRIEGRWKLIVPDPVNAPDSGVELYDVIADPHENTNVAASEPDRVARMRARINAWWPAR
jgi:uncharacterized sulfatase